MFNGLTINECVSWLNDVPRNTWYREKIKSIVKNKVVFEVGCGSGLLAAYCLEYGAAHYYGIDIRSHRAEYTRQLLNNLGYQGKHAIFGGNFLEFDGIDEKIDVLIVEQTGNQYQNNFMMRQSWQHAKTIFPYEFISLPDQWEVDVEIYEGIINVELQENLPSRFINDASLPSNYYDAVKKMSMITPYKVVKNAFTINQKNYKQPVKFSLDVNDLNRATFVLQDYISFRGDRCYTVSAVSDWPAPPVFTEKNLNEKIEFTWDESVKKIPNFRRGYWKI